MRRARALVALLLVMAAGFVPVLVRAQSTTSDAEQAYREGTALLASRRYREALPHLDEAIRLDPRHRRGLAYSALGHMQRAIQGRINPRVAEAYSNRGSAHGMLGRRQRAIDDYREATRIDPRFARAYAGRGVSLLYLHRDAEAETDFKKAFDLDPALRKNFEPLINEAKAKRPGLTRPR